MTKIVISGGQYPDNWKSIQDKNEENFIRFDVAEMLVLDWNTDEIIKRINYQSPEESRNPSMMFKGCESDMKSNSLNVVTNTELLIYDKLNFKLVNVYTEKSFNDLHGVSTIDGNYYIVNTGLEIIQVLDHSGSIIQEYNLAETDTWKKYDKNFDYRQTGSTKPHSQHINHIFKFDDNLFVTRLLHQDAVNLNDHNDSFKMLVGNPHDGVIHKEAVFFTTTNGHLITFDAATRKQIQVIDINQALSESGFKPGGWCRGVLPLSETRALIGYTQLRHTKFKEFISWAKHLGNNPVPTRILEIDLETKKVVKEFIYPSEVGTAIFSIVEL